MRHEAIDHFTRLWNRRLWLKWALQSTSVAVPLAALTTLFVASSFPTFFITLAAAMPICFGLRVWSGYQHRATPVSMVRHLNRLFPELHESADLLLRDPATLNTLERMQVNRLPRRLVERKLVMAHHRFTRTWAFLAASLFFSAGFSFAYQAWGEDVGGALERLGFDSASAALAKEPPRITGSEIEVIPPSYTGLPVRFQEDDLMLMVEEGAEVRWNITFDQVLENGQLTFSDRERLALERITGKKYATNRTILKGGYYSAELTGKNGKQAQSEFFKLLVKKDLPAEVRILSPEEGLFDPDIYDKVTVTTEAVDDYGFSGASALLTVASGSGESVKFRDSKIPINLPSTDSSGKAVFDLDLNFSELGMAAGDELYIQIEVRDNREPEPNTSRSATLTVKLAGEEEPPVATMDGLGVDRLPEYFRSQRQIIIDTEKLIEDKPQLSRSEFLRRANNLGIDQKILRLRYGKFLGEEFESDLGQVAHLVATIDEEDGHDHHHHDHDHGEHDDENMEGSTGLEELAHDHGDEDVEGWGEKPEDPRNLLNDPVLMEYVHAHDQMEEATFLPEETKQKLRECLAEMWDSEKYLRLGQPSIALPYAYRALKLLKEVQRADRVYIRRTALDLPPLEPDKLRLTGKLEDIETLRKEAPIPPRSEEEAILLTALAALQALDTQGLADTRPLKSARDLFAVKAESEPERYVTALNDMGSLLQTLTSTKVPSNEEISALEKDLWQLLTAPSRTLRIDNSLGGSLAGDYLRELAELNGDSQ